jgi:phenylacetate-coenzyme A ligase PaaK-like adenylate-forming protein
VVFTEARERSMDDAAKSGSLPVEASAGSAEPDVLRRQGSGAGLGARHVGAYARCADASSDRAFSGFSGMTATGLTAPTVDQLRSRRDAGLAATLGHARQNSPFYSGLLGQGEITPANARDILRTLPPMVDEAWQDNRDQIRIAPPGNAMIGYTSGTSGRQKSFLSTQGERAAYSELFCETEGSRARTLNLANLAHGVAAPEDYGSNTVTVPFVIPGVHFESAARILERRISPYSAMPPFEIISGTLHMVKKLTRFLLETDRRPAELGLSRIMVFTQMLSPRWRARIEDWWEAEVDEIYGFSELRMCNSRKCRWCSLFHFPPTCIGEVLDPDGEFSVPDGPQVGTLAVTAFYPYVQLEPRIRYCPGDVVEVAGQACPLWGEPGYAVLGREQHSIRLRNEWVCSAHCFSAIADLPDVATFDEIAITLDDPSYHECGSPQFQLQRTERGATLFVELRYDPAVWLDEAQMVHDILAARLPVPGLSIALRAPGKLPGDRYFV